MSRSGDLGKAAGQIERGHFSTSHPVYRAHLERRRAMACDIALMLHDDAARVSMWLQTRQQAQRMSWLSRIYLALRVASHGRNAADAVLEAAKSAIRMAAVHEEYVAIETTTSTDSSRSGSARSGRYRTEEEG
ncbi:hypothetical protein [Microtetraspora malaysiensis]|uniref:Uncharacterized protein n=1 Tax=Microtetraspora malaysiensis TaxID=161358 RepID=A0ABW6SKM2_9ACTN